MMGSSTSGGAPTAPRRSEGNMALGLFSKIAAARKENLSSYTKATISALGTSGRFEKKTMATGTSHFPELTDTNLHITRNPALRTPAMSERKVPARNSSQNARWAKQNVPEDSLGTPDTSPIDCDAASNGSGANRVSSAAPQRSASPGMASSSRRRHMLPPHLDQQRRSIAESSSGWADMLKGDREKSGREVPPRPATANEESVRGYVRRSTEVLPSPLDQTASTQIWHPLRHGKLPDTMETKLSDSLPSSVDGRFHVNKPQTAGPVPSDKRHSGHTTRTPNQEVHFAVTAEIPGVPIVYRNQKTKSTNPERLNLDRRNLPVIPLLEGEQILRLLNLQNNIIRRIDNLLGLPNLIFLDLYNNRIEKLENLHVVPNLRVLMMGKNRVRTIENLECLKKLDVLDLHSNEIEQMENLNELTELRVLNLGGNVICTLENIDKLTLLTELNLRRNQISRIGTIGKLPSLLRLFLSNNKLESFESLEPLFQVSSLNELRLDSNGVSGSNQSSYRSRMIRVFPVLKHLDLKPLSEIDRKEALLRLSPAKASSDDDDAEAAARARAISSAKAAWERRSNPLLPAMVKNDSPDTPSFTSWGTFDKQGSMSHAGYEERESTPTGREESTEHNDGAGFSEIELYGDYRVLVIHGNALEVLETTRANTLINAISFRFVGISEIIAAVTNAVNANLKVFTRLRRLIFAHNDLQSFDDLLWLSSLGPRAEEVFISHNPVCGKNLLRRYIGARLSNTLRFNGDEITIIDRQLGRQLFPKPSIPRSRLLDSSELSALLPSKPRGKEMKLTGSAVALDSNTAVSEIFCTASDIDQKNAALDQAWRGMLLSIVKETLQDIERRDNFMSGCLDNL